MSVPLSKKIAVFFILITVLFHPLLQAQSKAGIEQYQYLGKSGENTILPILHFEGAKGWYAEARYNYDELKTFSLYVGKSFSGGNDLSWSFTPMIGYAVGNLRAGSLGLNIDLEQAGFFLSAQSQFTVALDKENTNFFYNWSELGYSVTDHFFAGLTMQFTRQSQISDIEPGVLAGIGFKNISFPVYMFSPFSNANRYFVVGMNYEFTFKKKHK
jgi:hypothetical protein